MWFWLCILAICSLVDYLTWTFRIIIPRDKLRFVKRHLDIEAYMYGSSSKRVPSSPATNGSSGVVKRGSTMMTDPSSKAGLTHRGSRPSNVNVGVVLSGNETGGVGDYGVSPNDAAAAAAAQAQNVYMDIEKEKRLVRDFTFSYLKDDGIFALRIMASSASDLIVTEIMSALWKNYKLNYQENSDEVSTLVSSPSSSSQSSSSSSSATHVCDSLFEIK